MLTERDSALGSPSLGTVYFLLVNVRTGIYSYYLIVAKFRKRRLSISAELLGQTKKAVYRRSKSNAKGARNVIAYRWGRDEVANLSKALVVIVLLCWWRLGGFLVCVYPTHVTRHKEVCNAKCPQTCLVTTPRHCLIYTDVQRGIFQLQLPSTVEGAQ